MRTQDAVVGEEERRCCFHEDKGVFSLNQGLAWELTEVLSEGPVQGRMLAKGVDSPGESDLGLPWSSWQFMSGVFLVLRAARGFCWTPEQGFGQSRGFCEEVVSP